MTSYTPINIGEDFRRRFASSAPTPVPSRHTPKPAPVPEPELDLVSDTPPPAALKPKPQVSDWESNIDTIDPPTNIRPPAERAASDPVIRGGRKFLFTATANWAAIRKAVYPSYKDFCKANGQTHSIYEFNATIGPHWKSLSADDKVKALENPSAFFKF